jgi:hypothetical protein
MLGVDGPINSQMVFSIHATITDRFWLFDNEGIVGSFPSVIGRLADLSEFLASTRSTTQ